MSADKLQVAVGTANLGPQGAIGLNVVTTLRQPSGLSATLTNMPTLTGPPGFTVPSGAQGAYGANCDGYCPSTILVNGVVTPMPANQDAGTNHISGSPQVPRSNEKLANSTLGTFTGVYGYGMGPYNCDQTCATISAFYPGNPSNSTGNGFTSSYYQCASVLCATEPVSDSIITPQPYFSGSNNAFGADNGFPYVVGSPIVPFFNNGTFPSGFAGYSPGFSMFDVTPVSGTYNLSVNVPAANAAPVTYTASSSLNNLTPLGAIALGGSVTETSAGGLSGTVTVPSGVTETEIFIADIRQNVPGRPSQGFSQVFYTVGASGGGPLTGTGALAWSLPGNLGPCHAVNCQTSASAAPSIQAGDDYWIVAVGYDYPAFEAGPPGNTSQTPTITGANGQADSTVSRYFNGSY